MNPQETTLSNHNPDYFPQLEFFPLKSYAKSWAKRYEVIRRITLHRSLDPIFFGSERVKYVVVFEYLVREGNSNFDQFWEDFPIDSGTGSLLGAGFVDVYKEEPDFEFREDWGFFAKDLDDELPDYIDHEFTWHLFPLIPKKTTQQNLDKDKSKLPDLIEESIPDIKNKEYAFVRKEKTWFIKYKGKPIILKDSEKIRYVVHALERGEKGISIQELVKAVKGVDARFNKVYSDMHERERIESESLQSSNSIIEKESFSVSNRVVSEVRKLNEELKDDEKELENAELFNDTEKVSLLKEEIERKKGILSTLVKELSSETKKSYMKIRNQLNRAYKDIGQKIPSLEHHLRVFIKTGGNIVSYDPPLSEKPLWYISWGP